MREWPGLAWPHRIALGLVLLLIGLFALRQVASPDIGFHLTAGNYILSGNGWPQTDPFTYTVNDHAYIDTSWGYQVCLALLERISGAPGMILIHVVLVLTVFSLVALTTRTVPGEISLLIPLLLLGGVAAEPRLEVRPELLSFTFLALVLYLLHRHAEGLRSPLWLLPPIFLAWTNSHSLFVLGWVAMGCFLVGLLLKRKRVDWSLLGWTAASVAIGLVNPYGWRALAFPLTLLTRMRGENVFSRNIGEFASPLAYVRSEQLMFYLAPIVCFFVFALLVLLSLRSLLRQKRFWCVLLAAAFLPLSLIMFRNIPLLTVACLPGAVWGLSFGRVLDAIKLRGRPRRWVRHAFLGSLVVLVVVLGWRVCTDAYYVSARRLERFGLGWNALVLPIDAADYVRRVALPGRMLNHLNFGATLMWSLDEPVFIDGRLEVMGEEFYQEYRQALDSRAGLQAAVERHAIDWIIFPYRLRPHLLTGLARDPDWRLVYADHLAAIFVARGPGVARLVDETVRDVERPRGPVVDVAALPGLGRVPRSTPLDRWLAGLIRRQQYPTESFNRGVLHAYLGQHARAAGEFAKAIRESGGDYYETYNNLGSALFAMGRLEDARACYRIYLEDLPLYRRERRRQTLDRVAEIAKKLERG
jgi:tetratricopeptide (TPR) repeat protein